MANLTSTLKVSLIDDVSKPARTVAQALRDAEKAAEAVAKGMGKSGSDPFRRQLASLKLTASELRDVRKEWLLYARAQKQAMGAQQWATRGQGVMLAKEKQLFAAAKASRKEQLAAYKATVLAARGGRMGALGGRASDFASMALPGAAGMALGLGGTAAAGLVVGGAAAYSVKQAVDFDKAMAGIKKKVTLDPGATFGDVERMINDSARRFGVARTEIAALTEQLGQGGVAYKDLAASIELSTKMSKGWDISAAESAQTLTQVRAQTQWSTKEISAFADKVNYLGDISPAAEKDISAMWARTGAAAKASGLAYDDSLVAMTALRSVGMEDEVASRFLGQLTARLKLGKPALAQLGMDPKKTSERMDTDAMGVILEFYDKLSKSKNATSIAQAFGGDQWFDEILRMKEAIPVLKQLMDALASGGWKGSLDQALAVDLDTTATRIERIKALASEVGDLMSRWALPGINSAIDSTIAKAEEWLRPKGPSTAPGSVAGYEARLGLDRLDRPAKAVPTFQKLQDPFRMQSGRGAPSWAADPTVGRMGVGGGISPNRIPAFQRMQAKGPSLETPGKAQASMAGVDLPGTKIIRVEADTSAAQSKIDGIKNAVESIPSNVSPTVSVNTGNAIGEIGQVESMLHAVGALNPSPTVSVNTGNAVAQLQQVLSLLHAVANAGFAAQSAAARAGAAARGAAAAAAGLGKTARGSFTVGGVTGGGP